MADHSFFFFIFSESYHFDLTDTMSGWVFFNQQLRVSQSASRPLFPTILRLQSHWGIRFSRPQNHWGMMKWTRNKKWSKRGTRRDGRMSNKMRHRMRMRMMENRMRNRRWMRILDPDLWVVSWFATGVLFHSPYVVVQETITDARLTYNHPPRTIIPVAMWTRILHPTENHSILRQPPSFTHIIPPPNILKPIHPQRIDHWRCTLCCHHL